MSSPVSELNSNKFLEMVLANDNNGVKTALDQNSGLIDARLDVEKEIEKERFSSMTKIFHVAVYFENEFIIREFLSRKPELANERCLNRDKHPIWYARKNINVIEILSNFGANINFGNNYEENRDMGVQTTPLQDFIPSLPSSLTAIKAVFDCHLKKLQALLSRYLHRDIHPIVFDYYVDFNNTFPKFDYEHYPSPLWHDMSFINHFIPKPVDEEAQVKEKIDSLKFLLKVGKLSVSFSTSNKKIPFIYHLKTILDEAEREIYQPKHMKIITKYTFRPGCSVAWKEERRIDIPESSKEYLLNACNEIVTLFKEALVQEKEVDSYYRKIVPKD